MFAIVFDPIVCRSSLWWMFVECWGVILMGWCALALTVAFALAAVRRRLA